MEKSERDACEQEGKDLTSRRQCKQVRCLKGQLQMDKFKCEVVMSVFYKTVDRRTTVKIT